MLSFFHFPSGFLLEIKRERNLPIVTGVQMNGMPSKENHQVGRAAQVESFPDPIQVKTHRPVTDTQIECDSLVLFTG
jgi:hypothetical protein